MVMRQKARHGFTYMSRSIECAHRKYEKVSDWLTICDGFYDASTRCMVSPNEVEAERM